MQAGCQNHPCMNWSKSKGKLKCSSQAVCLETGLAQFFSIRLKEYFASTAFFSPLLPPAPPALQIIKKQKSKTEQAEADFEWPPSRSSGLASVAVSDQSMLTFPGSRRGSYTLWVSDLAQLLMFSAAQNWKIEMMEKCTYCLEWYVETCREQGIKPVSGQTVSLSCIFSQRIVGHRSKSQTLCCIGECVGED